MVKPIPPRNPAPRIFFHFSSPDNNANPGQTAINISKTIPSGFPITSPIIISRLSELSRLLIQSPPMAI
jgi:hypothetical protein